MRCQSILITPHEMWLELFWLKFNWTVYFCGLYFHFCFIACTQIQSFSVCFIFLHLSTLPRLDFPGTHGLKKHYRLVCFKRAHFKVFVFLCFLSWRMQTFQRAQKVWRLNSQISEDGTFVYYPFFVLNILLFTLFTFSYLNFFYYLFVLTYVDSSRRHTHVTTHPTRMQYFAPKWRHLMRFFAGATSRALALLLAFAAGNIKNLTRRLCAHEKIWARLVGKSVFDSKLRSLQRLIKESLAVCNLLFVYAVTL